MAWNPFKVTYNGPPRALETLNWDLWRKCCAEFVWIQYFTIFEFVTVKRGGE